MMMNDLPGLWPGVVKSYHGAQRTARVSIPGVTDGSDTLPEAVFLNPLGDRADETEIHIQAGDEVWLMFEGGDARFPIIVGYRTPRAGNPVGWRRWRHANIEITADGEMVLNASALRINADEVAVSGGSLTHNGTNIGDSHTHSGVVPGPGSTGAPD